MELHQVRYVLAVYEARNFTRAAERCAVSQPALTAAIRKLEEELEGPLFHRDRAGATLTALGELILPRLRRLHAETMSISEIAKNNVLLRGAPLRVGVLRTIGPMKLAPYLERFQKYAPAAELEIKLLAEPALMRGIEEGLLDVAIGTSPTPAPGWLVARTLYEERYMVTLPPSHPLAARDVVALSDLHREPYIDRLSCELRETVQRACEEQNVELYASYRTEDEGWIECLVRAGVGFAFLPEYSILAPSTTRRLLEAPSVTRRVALLRSADRAASPAVRALWEVFESEPSHGTTRGAI